MADEIAVEVVLATPSHQDLISVSLPDGATVEQAIEASGILSRFPDLAGTEMKRGVWGKLASGDQALRDGDRVELYRRLENDPKESRRQRATRTPTGQG